MEGWSYCGSGTEDAGRNAAADDMFMDLLAKFTNKKNRRVSIYRASLFADEPEATRAKISKIELEGAMKRLEDAGRIRNEVTGTGSNEKSIVST